MSVLINMEMPTSCAECRLMADGWCYSVGLEQREKISTVKRPTWCPLVPVPPHGDLIDLSAKVNAQYYDDAYEEWSIKTVTVEDVLYGICEEMPPTIIYAEEGE